MANSIALASRFQPILDEVYKYASITSFMDGLTKPIENGGVAEVKIFKISMVGLGTYSRTTGYPIGDVTGTWETITLLAERGREFSIDRMDNEETFGMAFGKLAGEFIRTWVAPEVDAYRFAKYAGAVGINKATPATLTSATVMAAIDVAQATLDSYEVPREGRVLFVSAEVSGFINAAVSRVLANESSVDKRVTTLDGTRIVVVPAGRFNVLVTLNAGATSSAGGFAATTGGTGQVINFILMDPNARDQATKHANLKIFTPEENQDMDAWKVQYRLYHDAWCYENKVKGIYLHAKVAA